VLHGCLTPNGRKVISASGDGTIRWWWLRGEDLLEVAASLEVEALTPEERQVKRQEMQERREAMTPQEREAMRQRREAAKQRQQEQKDKRPDDAEQDPPV
jgi:uncharacterized membrane protein